MGHEFADLDAAPGSLRREFDSRARAGDSGLADRTILCVDQGLCLRRPRHQLGIEAQPIGFEPAPEARHLDRTSNPLHQTELERLVAEEGPSGTRVDYTGLAVLDAEPAPRGLSIAAEHDDGATSHVL